MVFWKKTSPFSAITGTSGKGTSDTGVQSTSPIWWQSQTNILTATALALTTAAGLYTGYSCYSQNPSSVLSATQSLASSAFASSIPGSSAAYSAFDQTSIPSASTVGNILSSAASSVVSKSWSAISSCGSMAYSALPYVVGITGIGIAGAGYAVTKGLQMKAVNDKERERIRRENEKTAASFKQQLETVSQLQQGFLDVNTSH